MRLAGMAPAKINLTLSVLGRRADGFHEIDTLMVPLDFGDYITVAPAAELTLERGGPAAGGLPRVTDDLVWQAAALLARWRDEQRAGAEPSGAHVTVHKVIPTAAGLGGGSADAALTLQLLNRMWGLDLPLPTLLELAAELGSDVPFFLLGGPARATGRGERLTPLPGLPPFWTVLVTPPVPKETRAVYAQLSQHADWPRPDVDAALAAWRQGDWRALAEVADNTLKLPMYSQHPLLPQLAQAMQQAGALLALMSGAGPTVFGLVPDEATARAVADRLRPQYPAVRIARAVTG